MCNICKIHVWYIWYMYEICMVWYMYNICIRLYIHRWTHACMHAYIHTSIHPSIRTYKHACTHDITSHCIAPHLHYITYTTTKSHYTPGVWWCLFLVLLINDFVTVHDGESTQIIIFSAPCVNAYIESNTQYSHIYSYIYNFIHIW